MLYSSKAVSRLLGISERASVVTRTIKINIFGITAILAELTACTSDTNCSDQVSYCDRPSTPELLLHHSALEPVLTWQKRSVQREIQILSNAIKG